MIGKVGNDRYRRQLLNEIKANHVTSYMEVLDDVPTGIATIQMEGTSPRYFDFLY